MADLGTAVAFLTAVVELAQVKSIRNAMKANLIARGGIEGPLGNIEMPKPLGPRTRESLAPTGYTVLPNRQGVMKVAATPIVRTELILVHVPAVPSPNASEMLPAEPHRHREYGLSHGPLVPPWKMPLVPDEATAVQVIKCPPPPPDVISKGLLLDFFM